MDHRLSFKRVITPREHEFELELRYEEEHQDERERYVERALPLGEPDVLGTVADRQTVDEREREREATIEADYERPLGERFRLELGYEGEMEWVDNAFYSESLAESGAFTPDVRLNNAFAYGEQTHSAYGVLGGKLGPFGAQLGLRFEGAWTDFSLTTTGETFANDYVSLFPSVHLSYELTKTNTFKVSYSKRVRRPSEWQLNPFGDYDDPTSRRVGNPYLTPEYTHSGEVSYSHLGERYTITFSPYARYTVDEISWNEEITAGRGHDPHVRELRHGAVLRRRARRLADAGRLAEDQRQPERLQAGDRGGQPLRGALQRRARLPHAPLRDGGPQWRA